MPILVSRVAPNTPADRCYPKLNEGDQVLINLIYTLNLLVLLDFDCDSDKCDIFYVSQNNIFLCRLFTSMELT